MSRYPHNESAEKIQNCIDQTSKNGHGWDRHDDKNFTSEEDCVGNEVDPNGKCHNWIVTVNLSILQPWEVRLWPLGYNNRRGRREAFGLIVMLQQGEIF